MQVKSLQYNKIILVILGHAFLLDQKCIMVKNWQIGYFELSQYYHNLDKVALRPTSEKDIFIGLQLVVNWVKVGSLSQLKS